MTTHKESIFLAALKKMNSKNLSQDMPKKGGREEALRKGSPTREL